MERRHGTDTRYPTRGHTMSEYTANALETARLGRRYGKTWALRDCSFALPAGRVAALVGPNGAGKTTLLHLAVGLLEPTAGSVEVFGRSPQRQPKEMLPPIGFVAHDHPLYGGLAGAGMLAWGRKLARRGDEAAARARLRRLGIVGDGGGGKLPGGQRARWAGGRAPPKCPELLLLDEPLASLD